MANGRLALVPFRLWVWDIMFSFMVYFKVQICITYKTIVDFFSVSECFSMRNLFSRLYLFSMYMYSVHWIYLVCQLYTHVFSTLDMFGIRNLISINRIFNLCWSVFYCMQSSNWEQILLKGFIDLIELVLQLTAAFISLIMFWDLFCSLTDDC